MDKDIELGKTYHHIPTKKELEAHARHNKERAKAYGYMGAPEDNKKLTPGLKLELDNLKNVTKVDGKLTTPPLLTKEDAKKLQLNHSKSEGKKRPKRPKTRDKMSKEQLAEDHAIAKEARKKIYEHTLSAMPEPTKPTKAMFGKLLVMDAELMALINKMNERLPRYEKITGVGHMMEDTMYDLIHHIERCTVFNPYYNREEGLREVCVDCRVLGKLVEVAYMRGYWIGYDYSAVVAKLVPIDNLALSMALYLQQQNTGKKK